MYPRVRGGRCQVHVQVSPGPLRPPSAPQMAAPDHVLKPLPAVTIAAQLAQLRQEWLPVLAPTPRVHSRALERFAVRVRRSDMFATEGTGACRKCMLAVAPTLASADIVTDITSCTA